MLTHSNKEKLEIVEAAYEIYKQEYDRLCLSAFICTSIARALQNKLKDVTLQYSVIVTNHYLPLFIHRKPKLKPETFPWWPSSDFETRKAVFEEMIQTLEKQLQDETK